MSKKRLRSREWYEGANADAFMHRSWMRNLGFPADMFDGRPVIGICNTWSELVSCNGHLDRLAEFVKRGVYEAGGLPIEFHVTPLPEANLRPSAMLLRNLVSMDVEETIRGNPFDGVVLLAGCDKTTPALLMGAASCDLPTILVSGGPMLSGNVRGQTVGSGTSVWRLSESVKGGQITLDEFMDAEAGLTRSVGSCNTMGTASTMALLSEAMGIALPENGAIPAVDGRRFALGQLSGRRIVELVREDLPLSTFLNRRSFENAVRVNAAIGGSTNAVIHLQAIAGRLGFDFALDDWDCLGSGVPTLVDVMPTGRFLMEEFFNAGGLPALLRTLCENGVIDGDAPTCNGRTIRENCLSAQNFNEDVIRPLDNPVVNDGSIVVLRGNLVPGGAVLKRCAASPALMQHRGRVVVFDSLEDYERRILDPELEIDETCIMVLRNCGPKGYPGMPEVGNMGLPPKILARGITDMIRISDARMSGTAYGTILLHAAPEAAAGGPIGLVQTGDFIEVDVQNRRLSLDVSEDELERRRRVTTPKLPEVNAFQRVHVDHVLQADRGCDFEFLVGHRTAGIPAKSH
ncbi:IlvD/Edd family dehydratase [Ostreiculturibacter nitratireducens]|uniref:IlvD/Edd family dehydratase n=1 Tax=Ostreiculturibacter nitratireducens TaxID=3075226 RepID=UPI0031B57205